MGIDRVIVGIGGADASHAVGHRRHPGVVEGDEVGGVGNVVGRRKGCRPGDTAVGAGHIGQRAVGNGQVGVGKTVYGAAEGDGHQRGFADFQRGAGDHDGGSRWFHVSGVQRTAVVVDAHQRTRRCTRRATVRQTAATAGSAVATDRGKVARGDQHHAAVVPDRADAATASPAIGAVAADPTATATAATGSNVIADDRVADDFQGATRGVVDTTCRVGTDAADFVPAGTTAAATNGQRAVAGRTAVAAMAVTGSGAAAVAADSTGAGAATATHVGRTVTTAITTGIGTARAAGIGAGARARSTAMATGLATDTRTAATATADIAAGHTTATTTAGGGVVSHRHVVQGQSPGVENAAAHGPRSG